MNLLTFLMLPLLPFMMLVPGLYGRLGGFAAGGIHYPENHRPVMQRRIGE